MKVTEILDLAKKEVTGGVLNLYTPDPTVYQHLRKGYSEVISYFPLAKVITVGSARTKFTIPEEENVDMVVEVIPLGRTRTDFDFTAEEMFFVTSRYMDVTSALVDWITFQRNLRTFQVLTGSEFDWKQSQQDPNVVFLDNVPTGASGFTVKFTTSLTLPKTLEELKDGDQNTNLPEPQATYLLNYVSAALKKSEGAILKRFNPSGQAVEHDGRELYQSGEKEMETLKRELKERGFSLLSL